MTNPKDALEWLERKAERERNMTNVEWLNSLPINERADEIIGHIANTIGLARYYNDDDVAEFVEWLKERHYERN